MCTAHTSWLILYASSLMDGVGVEVKSKSKFRVTATLARGTTMEPTGLCTQAEMYKETLELHRGGLYFRNMCGHTRSDKHPHEPNLIMNMSPSTHSLHSRTKKSIFANYA
jgi:hypothetical protein